MPIAETRDWMGVLPADGSYVVRVFVYRSNAEKGERADYRLRVQRLGKVKGGGRAAFEGFLHERAQRVIAAAQLPADIRAMARQRAGISRWMVLAVMAAAFALGFAGHAITDPHRVDLLSASLIGIVLWNLLVYVLLGPSRIMVLGPDSTLAAVIASLILPLAGGSVERAIALAGVLALMTGAFLLLIGFARLGVMADLFSKPIRLGFFNAIALTVIISQLPKLMGFSATVNGSPAGRPNAAGLRRIMDW